MDELDIQEDLSYNEYLVRILEIAERITRSTIIRIVRFSGTEIRWMRQPGKERMI